MQSTSNEYFKMALDIKDILTVVNMQYYNSGSMNGCDGKVYSQGTVDFLTAQACIQLENGLAPPRSASACRRRPARPAAATSRRTIVNNALDCLTRGTNCGSFKPRQT